MGRVLRFNGLYYGRNPKKELNDIRFEFGIGKDSAEGIATELMQAGLVDGKDIIAIAANLQKLIDSQGLLRAVTFPLVSVGRQGRRLSYEDKVNVFCPDFQLLPEFCEC